MELATLVADQRDRILFECVSGSRAYGTSNEASDTDVRGPRPAIDAQVQARPCGSLWRDAARALRVDGARYWREGSDVDVLVAFDGPATSARFFGVQFELEDLFGCSVDLLTDKALRPELRPHVERDAIPA